jgi:hypothetical protein
MFETISNFFHETQNFFHRGYDYAAGKVHDVAEYVTSGAKTILEAPKNIIKEVYTDVKKLVAGGDKDLNRVLDRGSHTLDNIVNNGAAVIQTGQKEFAGAAKGIGESLSTPLVIGAGLFAFLMLNKR